MTLKLDPYGFMKRVEERGLILSPEEVKREIEYTRWQELGEKYGRRSGEEKGENNITKGTFEVYGDEIIDLEGCYVMYACGRRLYILDPETRESRVFRVGNDWWSTAQLVIYNGEPRVLAEGKITEIYNPQGKKILDGNGKRILALIDPISGKDEILRLGNSWWETAQLVTYNGEPRVLAGGYITEIYNPQGKKILDGNGKRILALIDPISGKDEILAKGNYIITLATLIPKNDYFNKVYRRLKKG